MKKITPIIISVAIILCVAFCFAGCAGNSDKHELTLKQNIADAGTISGEGKYNYDDGQPRARRSYRRNHQYSGMD